MNKHFNIDDASHESDWKDLTIIRLLGEVADLEDKIDKAIEYIENYYFYNSIDFDVKELLDILKGEDKDEKEV